MPSGMAWLIMPWMFPAKSRYFVHWVATTRLALLQVPAEHVLETSHSACAGVPSARTKLQLQIVSAAAHVLVNLAPRSQSATCPYAVPAGTMTWRNLSYNVPISESLHAYQ